MDLMNALNWPNPSRKGNRKAKKLHGPMKAKPAPRTGRGNPARRVAAATLLLGATVAAVAIYTLAGPTAGGKASVTREVPRTAPSSSAILNLPAPNLLRPLSPEEATKENADRPFVNRPDSPASRFVLKTDAEDRDRALNCLTQAVYYEAAGEGADGGRAVAQVVLNRMHHPGYPASVCGVVYQGADRANGCQFTFTCDGSLLRVPVASLWARSRKIAEDALAGKVFGPIGHATHYHADYVLPYWADSLDKTIQIGRHIFYRLRSSLGDSRSFFQRYAGTEPPVPVQDATAVIPSEVVTQQLASALISDGIEGASRDVEKAAQTASPLAIDSTHGILLADADGLPKPARQKKRPTACLTAADGKQGTRLEANDLRAGSSHSGC
jgi:spore germination cell wall hydrolase CwlJ-like protein